MNNIKIVDKIKNIEFEYSTDNNIWAIHSKNKLLQIDNPEIMDQLIVYFFISKSIYEILKQNEYNVQCKIMRDYNPHDTLIFGHVNENFEKYRKYFIIFELPKINDDNKRNLHDKFRKDCEFLPGFENNPIDNEISWVNNEISKSNNLNLKIFINNKLFDFKEIIFNE